MRDIFRSVRRRIKRGTDLPVALAYLEKEERIKVEEPGGKRGQIVRALTDD